MREIIHSGRCGLALILFFLSMALLTAQEPPPTQKEADAQIAVTPPQPPAVNPGAAQAPTDPGKAQDAATPPAQTPPVQTPPAQTPAVQLPAEQPPAAQPPNASQPKGKGRASTKKGKGDSANGNCGGATSIAVQEKPYVIGPEDVLYINVLHTPDVTGQYQVKPDGFVSVRFAGEIKSAGLTTIQLADIITDKLTKYFNHPEVDVQVMKINSKKYYVSGQVRKPGVYTLSVPKKVLEAIIDAGGPVDFAKLKGIYILRGSEKIKFNYKDVSQGKNMCQNILVENGDVIQVP
jgi:polysaccharide export outer membrane protein